MKCETCRWWKETQLRAYSAADGLVQLGYCEPPDTKRWKGLTAADYSCGEHEERPDAE